MPRPLEEVVREYIKAWDVVKGWDVTIPLQPSKKCPLLIEEMRIALAEREKLTLIPDLLREQTEILKRIEGKLGPKVETITYYNEDGPVCP